MSDSRDRGSEWGLLTEAERKLAEKDAQIKELEEKVEYFRSSTIKNSQVLDETRAQLEHIRQLLQECVGATVTLRNQV